MPGAGWELAVRGGCGGNTVLEMGIKSDVTGVCYIPIYLINK